jgi:hypothetical protein
MVTEKQILASLPDDNDPAWDNVIRSEEEARLANELCDAYWLGEGRAYIDEHPEVIPMLERAVKAHIRKKLN